MNRCPWHGDPCDCDGTVDPNAGRFAKWMPIEGIAPPWCELRIPLEKIGVYLQPPRMSAAAIARYKAWQAHGMPRLHGENDEDDEEEEPTF